MAAAMASRWDRRSVHSLGSSKEAALARSTDAKSERAKADGSEMRSDPSTATVTVAWTAARLETQRDSSRDAPTVPHLEHAVLGSAAASDSLSETRSALWKALGIAEGDSLEARLGSAVGFEDGDARSGSDSETLWVSMMAHH